MHGMICKSLEGFLTSAHGPETWDRVRRASGLAEPGFDTMLSYDDVIFAGVLQAAAEALDRTPAAVMEDVGTWICTHPPLEPVRRLFRFCGTTFREFLFSLDEIDARARMALPDLGLPVYALSERGGGRFEIRSVWCLPGAGGLLTGVLRVLASEYGALVVIDRAHAESVEGGWEEVVRVVVYDEAFHEPTAFSLGGAEA